MWRLAVELLGASLSPLVLVDDLGEGGFCGLGRLHELDPEFVVGAQGHDPGAERLFLRHIIDVTLVSYGLA